MIFPRRTYARRTMFNQATTKGDENFSTQYGSENTLVNVKMSSCFQPIYDK